MTQTTGTFDKPRLYALDLLRGIAALMVALGHFGPLGAIDLPRTFALCVPFFFMLSGYVLEHAYGDAIREGRMNLGRFAVARFARLYPLHFLTFAVVVLFWLSIDLVRQFIALPVNDVVGLNASPVQWFEALTLTHFLFGGGVAFNTPSWSISIELWCSFYVFALCLIPRRWVLLTVFPLMTVSWLAIEAGGGLLSGGRLAFGALEKTYAIGLYCFTVGWLLRAYRDALPRAPILGWSVAAFTFAALITDPLPPYLDALYYVAFMLAIAGLAHSPAHHPIMARAGDWSYGIYLWHMPIILGLTALVKLMAVRGFDLTGSLVLDAIYVPALLVVSAISFRLYEMPSKRWINRLSTPGLSHRPSRQPEPGLRTEK